MVDVLRGGCSGLQGTLVGLLAAFSYELSILRSAARLTSADAFRTLHALYRERTQPLTKGPAAAAAAAADADANSRAAGGHRNSLEQHLTFQIMDRYVNKHMHIHIPVQGKRQQVQFLSR